MSFGVLWRADQKFVFLILFSNPNIPEDFNADVDKRKYSLKKMLSRQRTVISIGKQFMILPEIKKLLSVSQKPLFQPLLLCMRDDVSKPSHQPPRASKTKYLNTMTLR